MEILYLPRRDRSLLETQGPLEGPVHKVLFVGTHPGLQQTDGSSEWTRVIQGEIGLCSLEEKARGTAANVPVLAHMKA